MREELTRVLRHGKALRKYGVSPEEVEALLGLVETFSLKVSPRRTVPLAVRDPKDTMVLAAALGNADYLVTGDDDLLVLADDPRLGQLRILTVTAFLNILKEPSEGR